MTVGVVGHTEWVDFAVCARLPVAGEILDGREAFSAAAGGGAVAAVQLRRLAGADAFFLTVLGDDLVGGWAREDLVRRGVALDAATLAGSSQRRAFTFLTDDHERTITVLGERMVPERARDALDWQRCASADAVYFTGGDADAARAARAARVLVATPRAGEALRTAGVELDVLVASASDRGEAVEAFDPPPRHVVLTHGADGGTWSGSDGGLTFGLGSGLPLPAALELAARCGAHCLTGRGPYGAQLTLS